MLDDCLTAKKLIRKLVQQLQLWFDLNHGGFPPHNMARLSAFLLQALFYANACSGWMLGLWKEVL